MTIRALTALASIAALCACNSGGGNNASVTNSSTAGSAEATSGSASTTSGTPAPAPAPTGAPPAAADPQVAQQVNMTAQMIQSQVPIKQGPTTITSAQAKGSELITAMTLPVPLNDQAISAMQQQLPAQQCGNQQLAQLIQRGARFTYEIKDSAGKVSRITVDSCPAGAGAAPAPVPAPAPAPAK